MDFFTLENLQALAIASIPFISAGLGVIITIWKWFKSMNKKMESYNTAEFEKRTQSSLVSLHKDNVQLKNEITELKNLIKGDNEHEV